MGRWLAAARALSHDGADSQKPSGREPTKLTKPRSVSFVSSDFEEKQNFIGLADGVAKLATPRSNATDNLSVASAGSPNVGSRFTATCPSTFHERAGMADAGVPATYLDAWADFQASPPRLASAGAWQRAIEDAGLLLDHWGDRLAEYEWPAAAIFGPEGLAWFVQGDGIRAVGPEHAITATDRVYDRLRSGSQPDGFSARLYKDEPR